MRHRSNVSPVPLAVERDDDDIVLEYLDGRTVRYRGPLEPREGSVSAPITLELQVLVLDEDASEGIMVYVNDYDTVDDILEETGVGRVLLGDGDTEALYPGVIATRSGQTIEVEVDDALTDAWVFVFVENQFGERAYRLARPAEPEDHCK